MKMLLLVVVAGLATLASAQVPGLGWCPEYPSMADFDLDRYLGVWYEQERYFTVLEVGSRCVRSNYTRNVDGKFQVHNEITNRLTGVVRVMGGLVQNIGKGGEGKIAVKYNTLPVPIETQYSVLDTDYDTYSVVWSCSSLGPINTQNAWVMTRDRLAPGTVLQQAYGVLDKFKISRTFFVKTDQSDCTFSDPASIPVKNEVEGAKSEEPKKEAEPMKESEMPVKEEPAKTGVESANSILPEKPMEAAMAVEELQKPIIPADSKKPMTAVDEKIHMPAELAAAPIKKTEPAKL